MATEREKNSTFPLLKKRFFAFYVDLLAITLIHRVLHWSYANFLKKSLQFLNPQAVDQLLQQSSNLTFYTFCFTVTWYFTISYYITSGKTLGKTLFGIQINPEVTLTQSLARSLGYLFCYMTGGLPLLIPFFTGSKGIPDWMSSTSVSFQRIELSSRPFPEDQSSNFYLKSPSERAS